MALADVLRERASRRGRTAQVDCGELGTLTVEALSPQECAALGISDGGRALLYAACRELQAAGEALRRERRLFTPNEVTAYVSDGEALAAARTVLALSGVALDETDGPDVTENRLPSVQKSGKDLSEIRLGAVQQSDIISRGAPENREARLGTVQESVNQFSEIRPGNVQFPEDTPADGQVSREFLPELQTRPKTQSFGANSDFEPQNLDVSEKNETFAAVREMSEPGEFFPAENALPHETTSEFQESVHEMKSESGGKGPGTLHEMKSEFPEVVHEIKSEFSGEGPVSMHETMSEFPKTLHESKSEFDEKRWDGLHEITSEFAEQLARYLLEGLRRAAGAR